MNMRSLFRLLFAGFVLSILVGATQAQAPSATDPDANAVREEQLLHELYRIEGHVNIPNTRERVLIQPSGRDAIATAQPAASGSSEATCT